ncbi:hypothetical protein BDA99DRAFT_558803 [Phascolomyces articulosus]|uniref:Uncharacterized protein n=1 Tax=Phascolomyces articulosus TaxID=60185 RepID=A0AAD5K380_9FUNG|nr:hypothetical protein BDA99DRAFT_558803 [Phascolomyces articulosus]
MYQMLSEENMWTLKSDRKVEKIMERCAMDYTDEQGTQSLIVDPLDPAWDAYFTDQERDEISATNPLQLSPLTLEMVQYLKKFENMVGYLDDIFDTTSKDHFNPKKNANLYWIGQPIINALVLCYCDFLGKKVHSESNIFAPILFMLDP